MPNNWNKQSSAGFTLVELLVVISIISILSAFLMSNFIGIRQRGRDAQRKSDIRQLQSALEMYRADVGSYPASIYPGVCPTSGSFANGSTIYMKKVPCDPLTTSVQYQYTLLGDGTYELYGCLENANDIDKYTTNKCANPNVTFFVTSP